MMESGCLEFDWKTADGVPVRVFSASDSYGGWWVVIGDKLYEAKNVSRLRDGGTTDIAGDFGFIHSPSRMRGGVDFIRFASDPKTQVLLVNGEHAPRWQKS